MSYRMGTATKHTLRGGGGEQGEHGKHNQTSEVPMRKIKKMLERNAALWSSEWLNIDEIGESGNSLSAKVRRERGSDHQRTSSLKKVTMLALSHTVPSLSTRTRELSKVALLSKESMQQTRDILTCKAQVCTKRHK